MGIHSPRNGLSLCAGGGGLDMGIMLAEPGFHTRCFVEWEPYPRSSIIAAQRAGYFAPAPIWDDLTTFDAQPLAGAIDTILAGYPCQPFSHAGQRKGEDDPRHLWPHVARVAEELGDGLEWIFLENVSGHVSLGAETVLRELWDMGFTPAAGLFSAAEIGAPHERLRWFCVAHRDPNAGTRGLVRSRSDRSTDQGEEEGRQRERIWPWLGSGSRTLEDAIGAGARRERGAAGERGRDAMDRRAESLRSGDGEAGPDRNRADGGQLANPGLGRRAGPEGWQDQQPWGAEAIRSGAPLADTSGARPQGGEWGRSPDQRDRTPAHGPVAERGGPRLFPPGPGDATAWADTIAHHPGLAPSLSIRDVKRASDNLASMVARGELAETAAQSVLCRMADGLAARTRALRLLGNGVFPLAAAHAWRTLSAAHGLGALDLAGTGAATDTDASKPVRRYVK